MMMAASAGKVVYQSAGSGDPEERPTEPGKVVNVVKQWLVYEDNAIANRMQNEEIQNHYDKNRVIRRTVREDIPVARHLYTEEEARAQYERMRQLEEQRRIAERDELLAKNLQKELSLNELDDRRKRQIHDEEVAKQIQQREVRGRYEQNERIGHSSGLPQGNLDRESRSRQSDYYASNRQIPPGDNNTSGSFRNDSEYEEEFDDEAVEAEDRELALKLQQEEQERYERKKQQKILAKERRRLEQLINQSNMESGVQMPGPPTREDCGDFSDFYIPPNPNMKPHEIRRLQEEQDAELARLLQDQEQKRSSNDVLKERLRGIEQQDAELARIIQEEENLRAKRRELRHQQKLLKQQREVAERIAGTGTSSSSSSAGRYQDQRSSSYPGEAVQSNLSPSHTINYQPAAQVSQATGSSRPQTMNTSPATQALASSSVVPRNFASPENGALRSQLDVISQPEANGRLEAISRQDPSDIVYDIQRSKGKSPKTDLTNSSSSYRPPPENTSVRSNDEQPEQRIPAMPKARANIPIAISGRLMQSVDNAEVNQSAKFQVVSTDIPSYKQTQMPNSPSQGSNPIPAQQNIQPRANRLMYAEKPAGRGSGSPTRIRELSPPGPALPERRYREEDLAFSPSSANTNTNANIANQYPPYREPRPPPYPAQQTRIGTEFQHAPGSVSPQSAETHYETPWDFTKLEHQILRDASMNQHAQPIIPRKVSPPGRRTEANPGQLNISGPGGRPLLEHNENGQIVFNINESAADPTSRRQVARHNERPLSQGFELDGDSESGANAGQRRNARKPPAGKRDSCKQQ